MKKKLVAFAVTAAMIVTSAVPAFAVWGPDNTQTMPETNEVLIDNTHLKGGISQTGTTISDGDTYTVNVDFLRTKGTFRYAINMVGNQGQKYDEVLAIDTSLGAKGLSVVDSGKNVAVPAAITTLTWKFDIAGDPNQKYLYLEVDNQGTKGVDEVFTIKLDKEVESVENVVFEGWDGDVKDGHQAIVYDEQLPSKIVDVQVIKSTEAGVPELDKYGKLQFADQPVIGETYAIYSITFDDETVISNYNLDKDGSYKWNGGEISKYADYKWVITNSDGTNHGESASNVFTVKDGYKGKYVTLKAVAKKASGIFTDGTWGDDASALAIMDRIAGADRFETAMAIADEMKLAKGFTNYVLATGNANQYADALSATAFAKAIGAPILLVNAGTEDTVADYIMDNAASYNVNVYVIGGYEAVSKAFTDKLYKLDVDVERLAGDNRYDTNLEVLKAYDEVTNNLGTGYHDGMRTLLVATGTNYADALSASATGYPVLLVGDRLTKDQREFLREDLTDGVNYAVKNIKVLGGTTAVNGNILNELAGRSYIADAKKVERIGGADRYATNRNIVEKLVPNYKDAAYVFVATGNDYADALAGGVLAAKEGAPLVLVNDSNYKAAKRIVKAVDPAYGMVVFGGENAVSNELVQKIA